MPGPSITDRFFAGAFAGALPPLVAATMVFGYADHPRRTPTPVETRVWGGIEWGSAATGGIALAAFGGRRRRRAGQKASDA